MQFWNLCGLLLLRSLRNEGPDHRRSALPLFLVWLLTDPYRRRRMTDKWKIALAWAGLIVAAWGVLIAVTATGIEIFARLFGS